MSQKKRKVFNIEEKSHIIWRLQNGESNGEIAKECGVSHSTISTIWKDRDKIKALFENNSLKMKRSRTSEHKVMEEALLKWFKHQRANNVAISGPILQQKANDFARLMGKENFECSSSWIQRFRARHNIVAGKVCGEAAGVPEGVTEEWLSHKWPAMCEGYKPEEIFNADETGLFYNLTPDKTLKFKESSSNMLEACRTCLRLINVNNSPFYVIEADDMQFSADSCRYKLLSIVPEMALNITPKSMLCAQCHGSLETLFEFKDKCLKTENIIAQYFQTKLDLDIKNFDLKDVLAFNTAGIKISEDEFDEVLVEDVAVKEEVELSDTAIVKHEVENFSSESVEDTRPKNAVPGSSADIKNSEDGGVEALVEDVAIKDEVKLSDTVITNVKHEVDDFSSESIAVVKPKNAVLGSNFICKYCEKRCKNSSSLKIHLRRHMKKHHLTNHLRTHNGEKLYRCETCHRSFVHKSKLTTHLRIHTGERPYICTICSKGFPANSKLTVHMQSHTGEKPHRCEICDCRFLMKHHLTTHLRTHTGEKPYLCETCDRSFANKSNLTTHLQIHTGVRPYICTICSKGFLKSSDLTIHMLRHTGEKSHRCEICDCRFLKKHHLTDHLRTHTGEKPYRCETCDRSFANKSNLTTHLRIHTGKLPYLCTVCGKGFASSFELTIHMRRHTGEKPHRCETCGRSFAHKSNLTTHLRIHTGERPYICTICSKGFPKSSDLTVHMRTHTGEKPYRCEMCDCSFARKTQLKTHLSIHTKHNTE